MGNWKGSVKQKKRVMRKRTEFLSVMTSCDTQYGKIYINVPSAQKRMIFLIQEKKRKG